ncbi:MAG TPA: heme o synthase [Thermoanaerobaculia bacterium]|nr:heme o synthase [Thermoanaerobaculia bacterium]
MNPQAVSRTAATETRSRGLSWTLLRSRAALYFELTKPRITFMVLVTAAAGFVLAHGAGAGGAGAAGPLRSVFPLALLIHALAGTGLVAASGSALNMVRERELDGRMRRTASRPLPAGKLDPDRALAFGVLLAVAGLLWLALGVNPLTAILGAATLAGYVFVYTPMKRVSSLATVVGAAPGAMPPVMGWAAYTGELGPGAWALFGILFFWQLPHFLAIAWMYRADYARAGFPMLPVVEPDGASTARQAVLWSAALIPLSLVPAALGLAGAVYAVGAVGLGIAYLAASVTFGRARSTPAARRLLLVSVAYLPGILGALLADGLFG